MYSSSFGVQGNYLVNVFEEEGKNESYLLWFMFLNLK